MYETTKCGICLESLEKTNVCITSCKHSFCLDCIIKNSKYNNCCPYCRIKIIDNLNKSEDEVEESELVQQNSEQEVQREELYPDNFIGHIDYEEECYHFPIVIENINTFAKVINEVTGGTFCSNECLGWILGIISIVNENEDTKFNIMDDKSFGNEILLAEYSKLIIMETIFIYKRSILLNKYLEDKIKNLN